ncbi:DUF192 domain-containing protein [Kiritimatiellota bacterium B12222]|nr:DUF192 domain-containing protein [Kiritimatiellota bacterium B12222]
MLPKTRKGCWQLGCAGQILLPRIRVADSFALRGVGLMGRRRMPEAYGAGLFFPKCRSLHGCFMRFDLEVWFLDAAGQPVGEPQLLKPWRVVVGPRQAVHCMEVLPGLVMRGEGEFVWSAEG